MVIAHILSTKKVTEHSAQCSVLTVSTIWHSDQYALTVLISTTALHNLVVVLTEGFQRPQKISKANEGL